MRLRRLEMKDAPLMLEWMHDRNVVEYLAKDFSGFSLPECQNFIELSQNDAKNLHLAIVGDNDEYQGTVSLKNIDYEKKNAEFAIAIRSCAMRKGYGKFAMQEILKYGKEHCGLSMIYWYAYQNNIKAIKFYEQCGYQKSGIDAKCIWYKCWLE